MKTGIAVDDVLSEVSHYKVVGINADDSIRVVHTESGDVVNIGRTYVQNYIKSGDNFVEEVKVTKEDKKDGTLGIRSIFEGIHSGQVFTVCFKKQDKPKSTKQFNAEVNEIVAKVCEEIDQVKSSKKGVAEWAKRTISALMKNPISKVVEGEDRVLRGYKIQFESRDGRYDCVDMDIVKTDKESGIRPVNINQIKWLIYNGVKYIVA
jgi:hypothetical protein